MIASGSVTLPLRIVVVVLALAGVGAAGAAHFWRNAHVAMEANLLDLQDRDELCQGDDTAGDEVEDDPLFAERQSNCMRRLISAAVLVFGGVHIGDLLRQLHLRAGGCVGAIGSSRSTLLELGCALRT